MYKPHTEWKVPLDNNKLWRYMDFTKFVDLLISNSQFFCRIDKFEDTFEGHPTKGTLKFAEAVGNPYATIEYYDSVEYLQGLRKLYYINCWHQNDYESAAMWKLYLQSNEGIAIQTNFKRLKDSIIDKRGITGGLVKYVDYDTHEYWGDNLTEYFVMKRMSFSHENEFRLFLIPESIPSAEDLKNIEKGPYGVGTNVEFDTVQLIESVYLSPNSPDWFLDLVKKTITKILGIEIPVYQSDLNKLP
ncbi:DUF2971 domain-containing protein [Sporosarcina ureae]|uniref:DUF2971 domain-containing protein n=1 Tax=Sporosarcina ureae TaxID=1571 RepID=UPI000A17C239|nr:DUF2971 domain-containing protein [Sporosarcina ureae]ARK21873.1 hypothetical protein SporoP32a_10260 [Sporosarcina ureae]